MDARRAELMERGRRGIESSKRTNAIVCVVLGVLFALFALACFLGAAGMALSGAAVGALASVAAFGLFWTGLTLLLLWLGVSGLGKLRRDARLRASGVRGIATVLSYVESKLRVDGATKFQLELRIEVPGQAPWNVSVNEPVMHTAAITTGAPLPVLVNPADPSELMIDWFYRPET